MMHIFFQTMLSLYLLLLQIIKFSGLPFFNIRHSLSDVIFTNKKKVKIRLYAVHVLNILKTKACFCYMCMGT